MEQNSRVGSFSNSEIWRLIPGKRGEMLKTGYSYIEEKRFERKLGRALSSEQNSKSTGWGTFVEKRAFDLLPLHYKLRSIDRLVHPDIPYWTAAIDIIGEDFAGDVKCPYTLLSFCQQVEAMEKGIETYKELKPEYYWQCVAHSILAAKKFAEIIIYVPYQTELDEIREMANNVDGAQQNKVAFINWAEDDQLPYLIEGGYYKNLNILRWEVSQEDKKLLTSRVIEAGKLLIKPL